MCHAVFSRRIGPGRSVINLISVFMIATFFSSTAVAEDWRAWRGDGSGVSHEVGLPVQWSAQENVAWKVPIEGEGRSQPIVHDGRIYLTTAIEADRPLVSSSTVVLSSLGLLIAGMVLGWKAGNRLGSALFGGVFAIMLMGTYAFEDVTLMTGHASRSWRVTGLMALPALTGAAWLLRGRRSTRIVAALLLVTCAVTYHVIAPHDIYNMAMPQYKLAMVSVPLCVAAGWLMMAQPWPRRPSQAGTIGAVASALAALFVLTAVAVPYTVINYLKPLAGFERRVICLDLDTGKEIWNVLAFHAPVAKRYPSNSYATPTPATDGRYIVADFGRGITCLDMDGRILWTKFEENYDRFVRYGSSISPVIVDDFVIRSYMAEAAFVDIENGSTPDHKPHSYIAALALADGKQKWRVRPEGSRDSYSTPLIVDGESPRLIVPLWGWVYELNAVDGTAIWSAEVPIHQMVPSAVADKGRIYLAGGVHGLKSSLAIRRGGSGDVTATHIEWEQSRSLPTCASPVLYEGRLYWATEGGIAVCVDASSGDTVWRHRMEGHHTAAALAGDGKIYFTDERGRVIVMEAGDEPVILSENDMAEELVSSPAVSDGRMLIRGRDHLFCIARSSEESPLAMRKSP